jgi:hypothetical protein
LSTAADTDERELRRCVLVVRVGDRHIGQTALRSAFPSRMADPSVNAQA